MADYGGAAMVRTPWGNASELRNGKLNPGLGVPAEEVERSQRERLFGAMVASVEERGYERTSVAELLAISGVSRASFYRLFRDKQDCFVATVEAILRDSVVIATKSFRAAQDWRAGVQQALQRLLEVTAAQPAAARLCAVHAYAVGPAALEPLEATVDTIAARLAARVETDPKPAETLRAVVGAAIGGIHWIIYQHLGEGREAELPQRGAELWQWARNFESVPGALLRRPRQGAQELAEPIVPAPAPTAQIPGERVLRGFVAAVVEKGYAETTIAEIAARAQISRTTFYEHFAGKEDAMAAAIELSGRQTVAATLPSLRRAKNANDGVKIALACIFGFLASEPDFARLLAIETYAAGPQAVALRNQMVEEVVEISLTLLLGERPRTPTLAEDAVVGAVAAILYERIRSAGPASLPSALPLAIYVALVAFVGSERAYAVARGERLSAGAG